MVCPPVRGYNPGGLSPRTGGQTMLYNTTHIGLLGRKAYHRYGSKFFPFRVVQISEGTQILTFLSDTIGLI